MKQKTCQELLNEFESSATFGLSSSDAEKRLKTYGKNVIEGKKKTPFIIKFLSQFADFLVIILAIAAVLPVIIDTKGWVEDKEWIETIIIVVVIISNALIGAIQENNAEKSLDALKKLSTPHSKVLRDGKLVTIESADIVPGDIFYVEAGDFIPADARIISSSNLMVDESALTGESTAVNKNADLITGEIHGIGDMSNTLFSSTYVTYGKAYAITTETGMNTEIGKIAKALINTTDEITPLQQKLNQIAKVIGIMCIAICVIVFVLKLIEQTDGGVLDAFKNAIALAVAAIPEGLTTVVTVVLAIGVQRLAKQKAIVKKLPAVETLGCANIICSDKTGTLTQNKMTVMKLYHTAIKDITDNLSFEETKMLEFFALCTDASYEEKDGITKSIGDPTEVALLIARDKYVKEPTYSNLKRVADLPFDSDRKLMTTIFAYSGKYLVITKGAPDVVISHSIPTSETKKAGLANNEMAESALRVLGVGYKIIDFLPQNLNIEEIENNLNFLGLVGMIDPARPEVKKAIKEASDAGIRTIMITGDHVLTAKAIALELGILKEGTTAISSKELSSLSDEELFKNIEKYSVYARVAPEDKVRIVKAWQQKGAIVAMTGDGVNDSPALKKADIGCAMGITGTDVAKEAADVVLTDDNFSTIVTAVKEGRGIYANIQKVVQYLLSSNIGEVLCIFLASVISLVSSLSFGTPLVATHLLWINLITDSLPAFALGMEKTEDDVMKESPRDKNEHFFAHGLGFDIIWQGIMIGLLSLISYAIGNNHSHELGQTMAFITLSTCQLFHAFNIKSHHSIFNKKTFNNFYLIIAFVLGLALQILICYIPGLNSAFNLIALDLKYLLIAIALSFLTVIIMEIVKLCSRKKQ